MYALYHDQECTDNPGPARLVHSIHGLSRYNGRLASNIAPRMSDVVDVAFLPPTVGIQHFLDTTRQPILTLAIS